MKIDRSNSKKCSTDVPFDCKLLIEKLKSCNEEELLVTLKKIKTWECGKCDLYHWIDILDIFDSILEQSCKKENENQWSLPVDQPENEKKKELLLAVISFTSILIEHSFSRQFYNSIEHLIALLSSTDMQIVLAILNLLFVFSKRSNFFSRISTENRQSLLSRLLYLADNWGGKDHGFGLAQCCQDLPLNCFPSNSTTFNFEFYSNDKDDKECSKKPNTIIRIHIEDVHMSDKTVSKLMEEIVAKYDIPTKYHCRIFNQLRLTKNFANYHNRLQCVQARLSALSIIVYCQAMSAQETYYQLLYNGFIEELVEVLELKSPDLIEIQSSALKALTSIIHLDRNSKLKSIIDAIGASSYHGFLPILVRNSINSFISGEEGQFPLNFATSLFSFLYHLASYESGCEALVQCGIIESLLKVIDWKGSELEHITFVTRAVRVIDLLTNQFADMNCFQTNNGLNIFVQRIEYEVDVCRREQPHEIAVPADKLNKEKHMATDKLEDSEIPMEVESEPQASTSQQQQPQPAAQPKETPVIDKSLFSSSDFQCYPQRAALLKSMLNFLKKAVQCAALSEGVRHLMYGNFPRSLRHIISNAEYYGSSLFLLATDVVSVYVYQEPSLLSTIQDNGLTDVVLYAILVKEVPPTKEVIASLPNVFTSLCLNHRGLEAFINLKPFERLFKIFISPEYLLAMRRRRRESIGDTATCLGNSIDELMRHQPSLRTEAIGAIIKLLEEICKMGTDPKYVCTKISTKSFDPSTGLVYSVNSDRAIPSTSTINNDLSSEEEEEDYDDDTATTTTPPSNVINDNALVLPSTSEENTVAMKTAATAVRPETNREQIPLIEYILNIMRFVDAILSNNSTDDHCQEFLAQNGLVPLFKILQLPNLPLDFPLLPACYSVSTVFKTILNLAREKDIFINGLEKLKDILGKLNPLLNSAKTFDGSVLLEDLISSLSVKKSNISASNIATPLLQAMAATHSFIVMFIHICRTGQGDIRQLSTDQWGSKLGIEIINQLSNLYISLVWESTVLLGLNDSNSQKYEFVKLQLEKLHSLLKINVDNENVSSPMEVDLDNDSLCSSCGNKPETVPEKKSKPSSSKYTHQKYIKPLLTVASRLGRSLAELFGLFVKLSVGSPIRRRSHHYNLAGIPSSPLVPVKSCQNISKHLNILLSKGLSWKPSFDTNIPKYRLTFYVCSIGFSSPMLFDDRNYPYHTMLQNFVIYGGHDAFFDCFKMAFNQNNFGSNDLPDGVMEFLDSWLLLLEKLINPQTLMESPYCVSSKMKPSHRSRADYTLFDPIQYLIRTHRKAFPCIMELWNNKLFKINCDRVIDSLLTIFSHLLKGEKLIESHVGKNESNVATPTPAEPSGTAAASSATPAAGAGGGRDPLPEVPNMYSELLNILVDMGFPRETAAYALLQTENDVEQAAEFLLSNSSANRTNNSAEFDMGEDDNVLQALMMGEVPTTPDRSIEQKPEDVPPPPESEPLKNEAQLSKAEINLFISNILTGTLKLLDNHPDMVYKCCELLIAVSKRNGDEWFEEMIAKLIEDLKQNISNLLISTSYMSQKQKPFKDFVNQFLTLPEASKLSSSIHLLALLFKEIKNLCAKQICNSDLIHRLTELLEQSTYFLKLLHEQESTIQTPKWLATAILLIDVYEKHTKASRIRMQLLANNPKRQWKYFDERSRWSSYTTATNNAIDEAFQKLEPHYRFTADRRRYIIHFNNMVQVNEDTSNWRPIMFVNDTSSTSDKKEEQQPPPPTAVAPIIGEPLDNNQSKLLIDLMVSLTKLPIDPDSLHAVMRLCLRLTRDYSKACYFAEIGGVSALLNLPNKSKYVGIVSLTTLIVRHAIEDENMLNVAMEKIIRQQANSPIANNREVHNIFRYFNPAACRDLELFKKLSKSILRFNVYNRRVEGEDDRSAQYLRTVNNKPSDLENSIEVAKFARDIVNELLNLLPLKYVIENQSTDSAENSEDNDKSIFSVQSILSLLAELTRSYNVLAKVICEHYYTRGHVDLIVEDCSAISFILDNMLFSPKKSSDKESPCVSLSIMLLTSVGSVSFSTEVHQTLIVEIKNSLNRAVLLPESYEKHAKIQALSTLIMTIVESSPLFISQNIFSRSHINVNSNSLIKLLLKKGILCDLAKVIQSLDLSSPFMKNTVNSILKTLEFLSKILNSPHNICTKNRSNRSETSNTTGNAANPTTNSQEGMDEDNSHPNANNLPSDLEASFNQAIADVASTINESERIQRISNLLDMNHVEENPDNELYGLEDNDLPNVIVSEDLSMNRNEMADNNVNLNCAESTSSDETQSDVDDDSEDEEVEEEDDDAVGSAQEGHEEEEDDDEDEDDDDQMEDDEEEEDGVDFFNLPYPNRNMIFNLEQVLPHVLHVRERVPNFISLMNDDSNLSNELTPNPTAVSSPNVLIQHPLLSNNMNVSANMSQFNPVNMPSAAHVVVNTRPRNSARSRTIRASIVNSSGHSSWHFTNFSSRTNPSLLQRLLGTSASSDFVGSMSLGRGAGPGMGMIDLHDDLSDLHLSNGLGSPFSNPSQNPSSTMSRWYEESRVLDDEYMYDPIFLVKPEIIKCLEQYKEEEIKEKKKKKVEDMDTADSKDSKPKQEPKETTPTESNQTQATTEESSETPAYGGGLHARIELIANSVINQVLEPPVDIDAPIDEEIGSPPAAESATAESQRSTTPDRSVHRMEVVSEEQGEVAMTTDSNSTETSALESANNTEERGENVPEVMDQSNSDATAQAEAASESAPAPNRSYNMTAEERAILGDQEIPEGVDPSFLAALPENIRQEVISEQFRVQRLNSLQQQTTNAATTASTAANNSTSSGSFAEVNPEFLAALPPNIQEEVLAQQRAEQQRLASQNTNPDTPVDPDSFFRSLPPSLRRQVLSDLDDSQLRLLPPDIAGEARTLRQEYEMRNRQFQERLLTSSNALSRIIRSAGMDLDSLLDLGNVTNLSLASARARFNSINSLPSQQWALHINTGNSHNNRNSLSNLRYQRSLVHRSFKGKFLLDYDALSSLLILLFIRDNAINSVRLYRLLKNLCYHTHTRQWIIQSLLEIMEKTKESVDVKEQSNSLIADTSSSDDLPIKFSVQNPSVSWLSISLDAAFGSKTNVFFINKNQCPGSKKINYSISINPQASSFVCRNVLEILIALAKSFPEQFISYSHSLSKNLSSSSLNTSVNSSKDAHDSHYSLKNSPNFFDVLLRHDSIYMNKKTKSSKHVASSLSITSTDSESHKSVDSPFSQLLNLLSHQFIKKSPMLIDRLVRLLTHVTYAMNSGDGTDNKTTTPAAETTDSKEKYAEIEKFVANEKLLKLVVDVLISKSCSEEGLVDATSLLIKLSTIFVSCRNIFYKLLLEGVRQLGQCVFYDISALHFELGDFLTTLKQDSSYQTESNNEGFDKSQLQKGYLTDRYSNSQIVINSSTGSKHSISGKEVQLASMSTLISKSSNQFLFLRILKIIIHIREINIKKSAKSQPGSSNDSKMEVDNEDKLSSELQLDYLWDKLSECLCLLSDTPDDHAVLVLQPAVEAFFLVHAPEKTNKTDLRSEPVNQQLAHIHQNVPLPTDTSEQHPESENRQYTNLPFDTQKFLLFAEKHRVVLNQILRQSNIHLANGPFAVLVDHTRILDFDVKRRYFRQELERLDQGVRRDDLPVHIRREHIFEDSYRELNRRTPEEWKNRFYVVFEGEEGQDAGGLLREWYTIISREIFNPNYALFTTSPGDRVTYMINSASHCNSNHLSYFKFVGRVIAKAIFDNKLLDCYFTRSFYKHILGKLVKYTDMESEDYAYYQGLVYLLEHNVNELGTELTFSLEVQEFGVTEIRDLVPNGRNIIVTEENKLEYVNLMCQEKMTGSIKQQLNSFLEGFYEIIPKRLISIFNEHELELLISGLPTIDIDDLKLNTEYHKYQAHSLQIQWFWRALRTFDQADRAKFLQFVTGTSKVPLQGFSALEGMNGPQKFQIHLDDRSTDRLPSAHTCFNQLDLPSYETYDKLRLMLLKAIHECSEGFGFA